MKRYRSRAPKRRMNSGIKATADFACGCLSVVSFLIGGGKPKKRKRK